MGQINKNIVGVVQARMGSTRLPEKVLYEIQDNTILGHIVKRLNAVTNIDNVWVATSVNQKDDRIEEFCIQNNINVFRGSEEDVLSRFFDLASKVEATDIVRITGDCPLIDPILIDELIELYIKGKYDHCGVMTGAGAADKQNENRFPDGLDAEIFSYKVLKRTNNEAIDKLYREHVTPYMWKNPNLFKLGALKCKGGDYSNYRWTIDNSEDFELIDWVYKKLHKKNEIFGMNDVIELFNKYPEKLKHNSHFIGKENYNEFWS